MSIKVDTRISGFRELQQFLGESSRRVAKGIENCDQQDCKGSCFSVVKTKRPNTQRGVHFR